MPLAEPTITGQELVVFNLIINLINNASFIPKFDLSQAVLNLRPAEDIIRSNGYPAEVHTAETEDGYLLTLHRIPHGLNNTDQPKKKPVIVMHAMGSNSASFLNMRPNQSIGYILADAGYDVWLPNARGNGYSTQHKTLDESSERFYDFSWHEIGKYDLPASIDFILAKTGADSAYYISHSQGGTAFYVMASERPEYNKKIRLASLMAPSAIMQDVPSSMLRFAAFNIYRFEMLAALLNLHKVPSELLRIPASAVCKTPEFKEICILIYMGGFSDYEQLDETWFPTMFETIPSPFSLKQVFHYGQLIKNDGVFRKYDYGFVKNMIKYKSATPPRYNISKITAPVALYYSENDMIISKRDIDSIADLLPNVALKYLVPYKKFTHMDHIFAKDAYDLEYKQLLAKMEQY